MKRSILSALAALAGLVVMGLAIFATQVGLDHNASWGRGRILLLILGCVLLLGSIFFSLVSEKFLTSIRSFITGKLEGLKRWLRNNPVTGNLVESGIQQMYLLAVLAVLFSLTIYIWYASVGRWNNWPLATDYYDQLGTAFRHGQLWFEEQPSPALLALPNPYDYAARKSAGVDFPWDVSLFNGKFTIYWGPMPGFILAAVKLIVPISVGDQYVTFGFLAGILIFDTLLIIRLWQRFFPHLPRSLVVLPILLAGLVCPLPWMIGRAAVYEATITGGQFFLMGGIFFAFSALDRETVSWPGLMLAVTLWACAALSRTIVLIPAAFLTFMIFVWLVKDYKRAEQVLKSIPHLLMLGVPLALGLIIQAWYNWARFGSVTETGLRYALTFINLNDFHIQTFSASYFPSNLWMYLFNLPAAQGTFPFILPEVGQAPSFLEPASHHHAEEITGLIFSVPFVLFAALPAWNSINFVSQTYLKKRDVSRAGGHELLHWISLGLLGTSFLSFTIILFYFNMTMRFLAEFMPSLIVLASLGLWQGYNTLRQNSIGRKFYLVCSMLLGAFSVIISLFLAVTGYYNTFQRLNPQLFHLLVQFFNRF